MKKTAVAFVGLLMLSTVMYAATFAIGTAVTTDGTTNVRATADGSLLGTQPVGAKGVVAGGPTTVPNNSTIWYYVNFEVGVSGWVGGDMLVASASTPPVKKTTIGQGTDQSILLDEFGDLSVSWYSPSLTAYMLSRSTNNGASWSTPVQLPVMPADMISPEGPSLAVERNGAIDALSLCTGETCPGNPVDLSVQLTRSLDGGKTFSPSVDISLHWTAGSFGADEPVILACGAGAVVVWQDDGIGSDWSPDKNPDIMFEYLAGGVPQTPINLSNTPFASEGHPQMVINSQGTVFVTWVTDGPSIVFASVPNCGAK